MECCMGCAIGMENETGKNFKATCRVLFGREIGELEDLAPYLREHVEPPMAAKSAISGRQVYLSQPFYCKEARFADIAELPSTGNALSINDIKDIDSALEAMAEKFSYCGNKNLGISKDVVQSDMCNDSLDIISSQNVMSSKHAAYCNGIRASECAYGCMLGGEVGFAMHSQIFFYSKRCFESSLCFHSTDIFCSFNCSDCIETMFSFNQKAKRHMIGNVELPKGDYMALKAKLVGEIALHLEKKKRFPGIFELADGGGIDG